METSRERELYDLVKMAEDNHTNRTHKQHDGKLRPQITWLLLNFRHFYGRVCTIFGIEAVQFAVISMKVRCGFSLPQIHASDF